MEFEKGKCTMFAPQRRPNSAPQSGLHGGNRRISVHTLDYIPFISSSVSAVCLADCLSAAGSVSPTVSHSQFQLLHSINMDSWLAGREGGGWGWGWDCGSCCSRMQFPNVWPLNALANDSTLTVLLFRCKHLFSIFFRPLSFCKPNAVFSFQCDQQCVFFIV